MSQLSDVVSGCGEEFTTLLDKLALLFVLEGVFEPSVRLVDGLEDRFEDLEDRACEVRQESSTNRSSCLSGLLARATNARNASRERYIYDVRSIF